MPSLARPVPKPLMGEAGRVVATSLNLPGVQARRRFFFIINLGLVGGIQYKVKILSYLLLIGQLTFVIFKII